MQICKKTLFYVGVKVLLMLNYNYTCGLYQKNLEYVIDADNSEVVMLLWDCQVPLKLHASSILLIILYNSAKKPKFLA